MYANRSGLGRSYPLDINRDISIDSLSFAHPQHPHLSGHHLAYPGSSHHRAFRGSHEYPGMVRSLHPAPSNAERFNLLTLNPRDFFKYRYEKPPDTSRIHAGFSGLLWIHLLAGRGLRAEPNPHYRDLYCVIESDGIHKARTVARSGNISNLTNVNLTTDHWLFVLFR